jgi:hypothetical protein
MALNCFGARSGLACPPLLLELGSVNPQVNRGYFINHCAKPHLRINSRYLFTQNYHPYVVMEKKTIVVG